MDYKVTDTELTDIADAIREKTGDDSPLEFPAGFVDAISSIEDGTVASGVTYEIKFVTVHTPDATLPIALEGNPANLSKLFIAAISGQRIENDMMENGYNDGCVVSDYMDITGQEGTILTAMVWNQSSPINLVQNNQQQLDNDAQNLRSLNATCFYGTYRVLAIYEDEE